MTEARARGFAYPPTRRSAVADTYHGMTITDPYRWLEDQTTPEVQDWMAQQNRFTDDTLGSHPAREPIARRLSELLSGSVVSEPVIKGDRVFFLRRSGGQNQPVLLVKEGDAPERLLLDPNTASEKGTVALDWWFPSPDGSLLAFGYSHDGDEWSVLHVLDVATGEVLSERIPRTRYATVAWEPDNSGFYYGRYPQPGEVPAGDENYHKHIFYHKLGADWHRDEKVWGAGREMREMSEPSLADGGRYLLVHAAHGWTRNDLYVMDRSSASPCFTAVAEGYDAHFEGRMHGGTLYVLTDLDAPRYRILAIDPAHPAQERWRTVVPQSEDLVITGFDLAGGKLVFTGQKDAVAHLYVCDLDGANLREVPLPGMGSIEELHGGKTDACLVYQSFTAPPAIYRLDPASASLTLFQASQVPVIPELITVKQVFYTSKDGTRIPMFILHRKDVTPNGDLPTVLWGYGGFNISLVPTFSANSLPWLENGGVYAIANLRGGSEYGEAWHRDGMLDKKQNVFDDYIAAAEYLIAEGYTNQQRLGISGRSNGGLLVGAALTQRPDLYKAVVCGVPLLDMLRYHRFLIGGLWVAEYGSADDPAQFPWVYGYSPYHKVVEGQAYPATYFFAAASDSRVDPLHARKMAALLQHTNVADTPILLRMQFEAGHGVGKPVKMIVDEQAEIWSFFAWQLGLTIGG